MKSAWIGGLVVALISSALVPAADATGMKTLAQAGGWEVFKGVSDDGRSLCGMATSGGGRWLGIKYFRGDSAVIIQLSKNTWTVKNRTSVEVSMQFDDEDPWKAAATAFHMSDGDAALEFQIDSDDLAQWIKEFARSDKLYVRFPHEKNIEDWQADLSTSQEMAQEWAQCIVKLNK
jgi:hypothetical protein